MRRAGSNASTLLVEVRDGLIESIEEGGAVDAVKSRPVQSKWALVLTGVADIWNSACSTRAREGLENFRCWRGVWLSPEYLVEDAVEEGLHEG